MEWWATQYVGMQCLSFVKYGEKYMKTKNGNQKWIIQRNWQHRVYQKTKVKAKTQHNMYWTPLYANKYKIT